MKSKSIISSVVLVFMLSALLATAYAFAGTPNPPEPEPETSEPEKPHKFEVAFSHKSGFYDESFALTLTCPQDMEIYYTTDGTNPLKYREKATLYTAPVAVESNEPCAAKFGAGEISATDVFSIKAVAVSLEEVDENGQKIATAIETRNFVKGTDVFERFGDDVLIFALNSDPHGLYDHYEGIFVEGIDREDWLKDNPGKKPQPDSPANYTRSGKESEREVYVEIFDSNGKLQISQNAGMRVKGGYSREHPQKSLELYAREEYGDRSNFLYNFFGEEHSYDGNLIHRYKRVRLRNGGSDRDAGYIRDELSQTLFAQAGHPTHQMHTPAAVFLNGEYYGVSWLKSPRTENHLARKYGGNSDDYEIIEGGDCRLRDPWWSGEKRAVDDIYDVFALAKKGFTGTDGQARFEEFCARVDVDELIRYYAMQVYIYNLDWPNHNIEMWRYFPPKNSDGEEVIENEFQDGKWRFFCHDIEAAWGIWAGGSQAKTDTLYTVLNGGKSDAYNNEHSSTFLYYLLQRDDMKIKFANTMVDLIEGAFSPENVEKVLDELIEKIEQEHNYAISMNIFQPDNEWWPSHESYAESRDKIRDFAKLRPAAIYESIEKNLGLTLENVPFALSVGEGGSVMLNSRLVGENQIARGQYFSEITAADLNPIPNPGYVFDKFTNMSATSSAYGITATFKKDPDYAQNGNLYISTVKATGNDFFIIQNDTEKVISTKGMYLSDSNSDFLKWQLPAVNIQPGESLTIVSKSNTVTAHMKRAQADFNADFGERLRLSDASGHVISFVEVSKMSNSQIQKRMSDGKFRIVDFEEKTKE